MSPPRPSPSIDTRFSIAAPPGNAGTVCSLRSSFRLFLSIVKRWSFTPWPALKVALAALPRSRSTGLPARLRRVAAPCRPADSPCAAVFLPLSLRSTRKTSSCASFETRSSVGGEETSDHIVELRYAGGMEFRTLPVERDQLVVDICVKQIESRVVDRQEARLRQRDSDVPGERPVCSQKNETRIHRVENGDAPIRGYRQRLRTAGKSLVQPSEPHLPRLVPPGQSGQRPAWCLLGWGGLHRGRLSGSRLGRHRFDGAGLDRRWRGRRRLHWRGDRLSLGPQDEPGHEERAQEQSEHTQSRRKGDQGGHAYAGHNGSNRPSPPNFPRTSSSIHDLLLGLAVHEDSRLEGGAKRGPSDQRRVLACGAWGKLVRMIILFFADVVGKPGRDALVKKLPMLKDRYGADAVVANGENATDGKGIKAAHAEALLSAGVDVITTGNHVWKQRDAYRYLDEQPRMLRPFNFLDSNPGRGVTIVDTRAGRLGVVNLCGHLYLYPARSPFEVVGEALEQLHGVRNVLVDLHAEATSEKVAMGWHLDGQVSAVVGTHTHVRTGDARVLPGGYRLHHRRGHVRPPRLGHRRQERAGARAVHDSAARPLRGGRRQCLAGGGRRGVRRRRSRPSHRALRRAGLSSRRRRGALGRGIGPETAAP